MRRFGQIVRSRREELGIQQDEVIEHGGPSSTTMGRIERGSDSDPSPKTLRKLDIGLSWHPGTAKHVLGGGDPQPLEPSEADRIVLAVRQLQSELMSANVGDPERVHLADAIASAERALASRRSA